MEWILTGIVRGLWGGSFTGWNVLPASRASGGILLLWDKQAMKCIEEAVGTFSISYKFKFVWAFSRVYGPNADYEKHYLWEELSQVFSWW